MLGDGRFLTLAERAKLSGVVWESVEGMMSDRQLMISFGNSVVVDVAGAMLEQIMDKWIVFEKRLLSSSLSRAPCTSDNDRVSFGRKVRHR